MTNAPDLALISMLEPDTDEVAAFEEFIGSHGGLGGPQTTPFLMIPADWPLPNDALLGAPAVYRLLCACLARLGLRPDVEVGRARCTNPTTRERHLDPRSTRPVRINGK